MARAYRSIALIDCEGCGKAVEHDGTTADPYPPGWFYLHFGYKGTPQQAEFCSPACLITWVQAPLETHLTNLRKDSDGNPYEVGEWRTGDGPVTVPSNGD